MSSVTRQPIELFKPSINVDSHLASIKKNWELLGLNLEVTTQLGQVKGFLDDVIEPEKKLTRHFYFFFKKKLGENPHLLSP